MEAFNIDHGRTERVGFPEIIYGRSKSADVVKKILENYQDKGSNALITKLQKEKAQEVLEEYPQAFYDEVSEVFILDFEDKKKTDQEIAILSGGTSDAFIVNEIYYTLAFLGHFAARIMDIGVSGVHRLMSRLDELKKYKVLIVVAGFEGALPTVVGGLLPQPIIAVPASVGYGVSAEGKAALNTMLSSCANGITVVNIDNGYGAAKAAVRIMNLLKPSA